MQDDLRRLCSTGSRGSRPGALAGGQDPPWVRPLFESLLRAAALSASNSDAAQWYLDVLEDLDAGGSPAVRFALPSSMSQEEGAL